MIGTSRNGSFESQVKRLADILHRESDSSINLVQEIMKNVSEHNLTSFLDIVLEDGVSERKNSGMYNRLALIVDSLSRVGIIRDEELKESLLSISGVAAVLVMQSIRKIATAIKDFTEKCIRLYWGTDSNACDSCGTLHAPGALYCSQCGAEILSEAWDTEMNRAFTEIAKALMKKAEGRYYYMEEAEGSIYGGFYRNNLSDRDIMYIINTLRSMSFHVHNGADRIFFDGHSAKGCNDCAEIIRGLASELGIEKIDLAL